MAESAGVARFSFDVDPVEERLNSAPLARCLMQVRFSHVPELVEDDTEREIARLLPDLPVRSPAGTTVQVEGFPPISEPLRVFESAEPGQKATLAQSFVAFETGRYATRAEFLQTARTVLAALRQVNAPARVVRIGVRYTNVFTEVDTIGDLIHPALLGSVGYLEPDAVLDHQVVVSNLRRVGLTGSGVSVRGLVAPANAMIEPGLPVSEAATWVLDIDAFDEQPRIGFDVDELAERIEALSHDAFRVFAWGAARYIARDRGEEQWQQTTL